MDTDDLTFSDRFEKRAKYLKDYSEVGVLGTNSIELFDDQNKFQFSELPLGFNSIIKLISKRNPFSHPTVFLKKMMF